MIDAAAQGGLAAIAATSRDVGLHRVDQHTEPGLFWSQCGGGGSIGVVIATEINLLAIGVEVVSQLSAEQAAGAAARWSVDGTDAGLAAVFNKDVVGRLRVVGASTTPTGWPG